LREKWTLNDNMFRSLNKDTDNKGGEINMRLIGNFAQQDLFLDLTLKFECNEKAANDKDAYGIVLCENCCKEKAEMEPDDKKGPSAFVDLNQKVEKEKVPDIVTTGGYQYTGDEPSIAASINGQGLIELKFDQQMQFNSTSADLLNNDS
jgi:hypothetical protein